MLQPKKYKYKKLKKRYIRNQKLETKANNLKFGSAGLKILESGKFTAKKIETLRQTINRFLNRKGKIWIRVFPDIPVSAKPSENRMGKGKGNIDRWVSFMKAGTMLFEIHGVSIQRSKIALQKAQKKIFLKTKLVFRDVK